MAAADHRKSKSKQPHQIGPQHGRDFMQKRLSGAVDAVAEGLAYFIARNAQKASKEAGSPIKPWSDGDVKNHVKALLADKHHSVHAQAMCVVMFVNRNRFKILPETLPESFLKELLTSEEPPSDGHYEAIFKRY